MPSPSRVAAQPSEPLMLSKRQAAAYLGLSVRSLERLVAQRTLEMVRPRPKAYRFKRVDLERYVESLEYTKGYRPGDGL